MAIFPALKPSSRSFTPGVYPHSEIRTLSGGQSRVRQSNVLVDQRLRLSFIALTEAEMLSIRTHYVGQQGRFLAFQIPNELLNGVTTPANFTPAGYQWIYAATPNIQDVGCQRYTVSLELVTVPYEGANINGSDLTVASSIAAGTATGTANVTGFDLTATAALVPGAPGGDVTFAASGAFLVASIGLLTGEADSSDQSDTFNFLVLTEDSLLFLTD
jgi:hypothetical protein